MVPSRAFVGITIFGLIASLLTVPYTILVWTGLRPSALSPALAFEIADDLGFRIFLLVASGLSIGLTVWAWRRLLESARHDAKRREARKEMARERALEEGKQPPGAT